MDSTESMLLVVAVVVVRPPDPLVPLKPTERLRLSKQTRASRIDFLAELSWPIAGQLGRATTINTTKRISWRTRDPRSPVAV